MRVLILIIVLLLAGCKPLKEMETDAAKIREMKIKKCRFQQSKQWDIQGKM